MFDNLSAIQQEIVRLISSPEEYDEGYRSPLNDLIHVVDQTHIEYRLLLAGASRYGILLDIDEPYLDLVIRLSSVPEALRKNREVPGLPKLEDIVDMEEEEFHRWFPNGDYQDRLFYFATKYQ